MGLVVETLTESDRELRTLLDLLLGSGMINADTETTVIDVGVEAATIVFNAIAAIIVLVASGNDLEDLAHKQTVRTSGVVDPGTVWFQINKFFFSVNLWRITEIQGCERYYTGIQTEQAT